LKVYDYFDDQHMMMIISGWAKVTIGLIYQQ